MPFTVCPFCGVASEIPHDTQESCISALRAEIARAQSLLTRAAPPANAEPPRNQDPGTVSE
jgi:pyruvate/2-oxoglutarate/acetoin dehydrogenase E1 component